MKPYFEDIAFPDGNLPAIGFITKTMEHVIEVHPHWHPEVEILYYIKGAALQQVNNSIFTAGPGDIVIIGKDQLHSTYHTGESHCDILVLQFDAGALLPDFSDFGATDAGTGFSDETIFGNPIGTTDEAGRQLLACIEEIYGELRALQPAHQTIVRASVLRLSGLLARFGKYLVNQHSAKNMKNARTMLESTFRLVDKGFSEEIKLEDAAHASNLSVTHFCRLFHKTTGLTFHDYLTFYRVSRAEKMLSSQRKLAEIAFDCGFGSVSSFIRNFKKFKNCTPSRFLQNHLDK